MPIKPTDLVKPWGTAGNYPVGNYPLLYPWGDPNPLGGTPVPWGGLARIDAGDITAFSANGFTPQLPDDPESYNRWLNTVYQNAAWVEAGSDTNDADAHIVETDLFGIITAVAFESEFSYQGLGGTPALFANGATVNDGQTLTLTGGADIAGGATSRAQAATIEGAVIEVTAPGAVPTLRQLGAGTNDVLLWHDGALKAVHSATSDYIYATGDQEAVTAPSATTQVPVTTVRLLPKIAINVRVIAEGWGQRSAVGDVSIKLEADDGASNYSTIGNVQTSTWVDTSTANLYSPFRIERVFAAGTVLNRFYRCEILGLGGATAKIRESSIRVVPER